MLIAGMPEKGAAFVASMDATAGFVSFISSVYTQAEPINRLSPEVFLLHEGKFSGLVKVSYDSSGEGGPPKQKQGLLRRLWSSLFG